MRLNAEKTRPLDGWVLCRAFRPRLNVGKLVLPSTIEDKNVVSEGVAKVVASGPGPLGPKGKRTPTGLEKGDKILYRGFLRFGHQLGDMFGADATALIFLLDIRDVLGVVEGPGTIGLYGEYVFEE